MLNQGGDSLLLADRMSGRSTGIALQQIGEALQFPGTMIRVRDHVNSYYARKQQYVRVQDLVTSLGLRCFTFNPISLTITYSKEW
jgi:hypothetical protein